MRRILLTLSLLSLIFTPCFAEGELDRKIELDENTYAILQNNSITDEAGGGESLIKFNTSVGVSLIYIPKAHINVWGWYDLLAFWPIFEESAPFRSYNHEPKVAIRADALGPLKDVRLGYWHHSNGLADEVVAEPVEDEDYQTIGEETTLERSMGWDRAFLQGTYTYEIEQYNIGFDVRVKAWYVLSVSENTTDLATTDFSSIGVDDFGGEVKLTVRRGEWGEASVDFARRMVKPELLFHLFPEWDNMYMYLQGFSGYGEDIGTFDTYTNSFGGGVALGL